MRQFLVVALLLVVPVGALAQVCTEQATIGQFELTFEGATYDGTDTEFEYCVTGLDDPALSHWDLTLDTACIDPANLTGCGPEPCDYQVDDPTTGITGIKWDDVEVDPGETECYTFSLAGDWTGQLGDVLIGLKAGQGIHYGDLCGPICRTCASSLAVVAPARAIPTYSLILVHNRPISVETRAQYTLYTDGGQKIKRWQTDTFTLADGDRYRDAGMMPLRRALGPGNYRLEMVMRGMSNWIVREVAFSVPE